MKSASVDPLSAETDGKTAFDAALTRAHHRQPFTDALSSNSTTSVISEPKVNLVLDGRVGRARFLAFGLILTGLLVSVAWLQSKYPRQVSDDAFLLAGLVICAVGALVIALRSRAAGVPPWVTFLGMGCAGYFAPWGIALIVGALLLMPSTEKDRS